MSQNKLNKSNTILSKSFKKENKNISMKKENKNYYEILKPLSHDNTKLCQKMKNGNIKEKNSDKKEESEIKLVFLEPKKKRIDENFIRTNVDKKFLCSICEHLLKDPTECYKCLNLFCIECIKQKIEDFKKCPKCFNIIFRDMMRNLDMDKIENYRQARVKCPFVGCRENLRLKEIEEHLESCIFQDMTEKKKEGLNKLIFQNNSDDPIMKTHMLNFLKEINISLKNINLNNSKVSKPLTLEDLGFKSKLSDLKDQMNNLNEYTSKTMGDMTKLTKQTNANLKNLINN